MTNRFPTRRTIRKAMATSAVCHHLLTLLGGRLLKIGPNFSELPLLKINSGGCSAIFFELQKLIDFVWEGRQPKHRKTTDQRFTPEKWKSPHKRCIAHGRFHGTTVPFWSVGPCFVWVALRLVFLVFWGGWSVLFVFLFAFPFSLGAGNLR